MKKIAMIVGIFLTSSMAVAGENASTLPNVQADFGESPVENISVGCDQGLIDEVLSLVGLSGEDCASAVALQKRKNRHKKK